MRGSKMYFPWHARTSICYSELENKPRLSVSSDFLTATDFTKYSKNPKRYVNCEGLSPSSGRNKSRVKLERFN